MVAMADVAAVLASKGLDVSPAQFNDAVFEALKELPPLSEMNRPDRELTATDADMLRRGGFDLEVYPSDEKDPFVQGRAVYLALIGSALSVAEAARKLGVDTSRIRQRCTQRTLYGLKLHGSWRVPTFQFEDDKLIPGVAEVISALAPDLDAVSLYTWFTTPNDDLIIDRESSSPACASPREWLLMGRSVGNVVELAEDL